ncbi:hypothetical protein X975_00722, partial [Stegodyphus mimosarum]
MFKIIVIFLAVTCCISASPLIQSKKLCGDELSSTVVLLCKSFEPSLDFSDVIIPQSLADECCHRPCSPLTLISFCPFPVIGQNAVV